jgi:hypothetical protein
VKAVRYMPKIHGRCPLPKSMTPTVRTSPEIKKECHLGEPESRVVNSDCERLGDRHDIGYARSGAE